jgi:hypothetical protein
VRDQATSPLSSSLPPPGTITHVERQAPYAPTVASSRPPRLEPPQPPGMFIEEPTRATARTPLLLALGVLAMMGVAVAMVVLRKSPPAREAPALPVVAADPVLIPERKEEPPAPPTDVTVEVLSEPAGASVESEGRALCASTPCRFQVARGAKLKLALQKAGYKPSATELTPERDLNQVQLTLAKKREHTKGHRMEGDLMLPDAFGNR